MLNAKKKQINRRFFFNALLMGTITNLNNQSMLDLSNDELVTTCTAFFDLAVFHFINTVKTNISE